MAETLPRRAVEVSATFSLNVQLANAASNLFRHGLTHGERQYAREGLKFYSFRRHVEDQEVFYGMHHGKNASLDRAIRDFRQLPPRLAIGMSNAPVEVLPEDLNDQQVNVRRFLFKAAANQISVGMVNKILNSVELDSAISQPRREEAPLLYSLEVPTRLLPASSKLQEAASSIVLSEGFLFPRRLDIRDVAVEIPIPKTVA